MADASNSPSGASTSNASGEFDPRYSAEDATLVIVSSDGVKFRVHPLMLRMASEIFNDMLTRAVDTGEPIALQERGVTVRNLLNFIYPDGPSFDFSREDFYSIWDLLVAADKYGIRKILSDFHLLFMSDSCFKGQPTQAFVIASRLGWEDVVDKYTLDTIDKLGHFQSYKYFARLDSTVVLKLQRFADLYKSVHLTVIRDLLDTHYNFDRMYDEEYDCTVEDCIDAQNALKVVRTFARDELHSRSSGKMLQEVLKSGVLKEYLFKGWEYEYEELLDCEQKFPKALRDIDLGDDSGI